MVILDTNVISELMKPLPEPSVLARLRKIDQASTYTTSITAAELWYGAKRAADGQKKRDLEASIAQILGQEFAGRILPFDSDAAEVFAEIMVSLKKQGQNPDIADMQIAAIAKSRDFSVVTRNIKHFEPSGVVLIDPWLK